MKIIDKLLSVFKKDSMVEKLYKIGAYHEAGHAVLGFYSGFEVKSISLIAADPGSGITRFDYGIDNLLIAGILNAKKDPAFFNSLSQPVRTRSPQACLKICNTLIAGPVTEAIYKFGIDYTGNMEVGIKDPDAEGIEAADYVLSIIDKTHSKAYIQETIISITEILRSEQFWTVVISLSDKLLNSKAKTLAQQEIEAVFEKHNFTQYNRL
jgi:hypothetical protein